MKSHNMHMHDDHVPAIKMKLLFSAVASVFLMIAAMVPKTFFIIPTYLQLIIATAVQFWVGGWYYVLAWHALRKGKANMYTLIALGTSAAYFYSVFVLVFQDWFIQSGLPINLYFESASMIITFILLGNFLEERARGRASFAIKELISLKPDMARVLQNEAWVVIDAIDIKVGDIVLIKPGEKIPADGVIIKGESSIDESMITGESVPVFKKVGAFVIGATLSKTGSFQMKVTKVGKLSLLDQIIELVKKAQASRMHIQKFVDLVSSYFVPLVIIAAIISAIVWWLFGPEPKFLYALIGFVSVLIIACPCALGLATPTSVMVAVGRAAREGLLIKDSVVFEVAHRITMIAFDKTGTITVGEQQVQDFQFVNNEFDKAYIRSLVLSVEKLSSHQVSDAVVRYLEHDTSLVEVEKFQTVSGLGVKAFSDDREILIGSRKFMEENGVVLTQEAKLYESQWLQGVGTISFVSIEKKLVAFFCLADTIRVEVKHAIAELKKMGITSVMITGDSHSIAQSVARKIDIDVVIAQVLPNEKAECIKKLKSDGAVVAMVGDGINDAPALAVADVGIAVGSGTDIAIEAAQIALLRSDLSLVPVFIKFSRLIIKNIRQNLFWAFGYNILLIPVAMGVLYPFLGIIISPMLAGFAMSFSSLSVVLNSLRLKYVSIR